MVISIYYVFYKYEVSVFLQELNNTQYQKEIFHNSMN